LEPADILYAAKISVKPATGQLQADSENYQTYETNASNLNERFFKLTILSSAVSLSSVSYNGVSIANGSGIPQTLGGAIDLTGAASGHDKLVYKIVQAENGGREIVGCGEGSAGALTVDTKGLTDGGDYTLYVWAQKDNAINSNEGSTPMYFKLGANTVITPAPVTAVPTSSTVLVNGEAIPFDAYNINGNNYFKLRDLAFVLNGTNKQFSVGYDETTKAITLTSGKPYVPVGGEMTGKGEGSKTGIPTESTIYLDGKQVSFTAYNIDGNNYFKLRDIGEAINFGVDWDAATSTVIIDTSKGYTAE
jgi:hypothetical protein